MEMSKEKRKKLTELEKIQRRFDRKWEKAIKLSEPKTFRGMEVLRGFPNNIEIYAYLIGKTPRTFLEKGKDNPNDYYDAIIYKNKENGRYYFLVRDIRFNDDKKSSFKVLMTYTRSAATFKRIVGDYWRFYDASLGLYPDLLNIYEQLKEQGLVKGYKLI
jgi:hypothetical protein